MYCVSCAPAQIAKDTHGFVGADISQLCMEAALRCIREQMHTIDVEADKIPVVRLLYVKKSAHHDDDDHDGKILVLLISFFVHVRESKYLMNAHP